MFIGHFALGFAAKRAAPRVQLAMLFIAAQLADLLWPLFLAAGIEQVRIDPGNTAFTPLDFVAYPYSHSLVMLLVWSVLFAAAYLLVVRPKAATGSSSAAGAPRPMTVAVVLAALVVSHWLLDFVTHRPDMPLYPGGPRFGLGLWNSVAATIAIESLMFVAGVWIYVRATRPRDGVGRWAFAGLTAFLAISYVANLAGGAPPSVTAIVVLGIIGAAILLVWAWWADAHRDAVLS